MSGSGELQTNELAASIDALTAANRSNPDPEVEAQLLELRARAFAGNASLPPKRPESAAAASTTVDRTSSPPEVVAEDLSADRLREGILGHGSLVVRGLLPSEAVDRLVSDMDLAFQGARAYRDAGAEGPTTPWYRPFVPPSGQSVDFDRMTVEEHDGVLAADSPRTMFDLIDSYERAGLRDVITTHLGERPVLTVKKTTLRRVGAETGTQWWHQDGAFLGRVGALNVWLSLSHCGVQAPSLDLVSRRCDEILPTGIEGADFDWSLGRPVVDRAAEGNIVRPSFGPGDALLFDELLVHQTGSSPDMRGIRYAIESWFFAPSVAPADRVPLLF